MKNKRSSSSENKEEIAKAIAKKSKSIQKTYSRFEFRMQKTFRFLSSGIDRVLFGDRHSKLVALTLATVICFIVSSGSTGNIFTNNIKSAIDLDGIRVVSNASNSIYEITGLPETADVTITGETGDVQYASQQKENYQVQANLKDVGEGVHEITLEPLNFPNKVEVIIKPSTVFVTVKKKISRSFTLGYDFINLNKMDKKYSLSDPEFLQNEVIVRASEDTMSEIAYVKALIDVDGVKADFEQDAVIVAYNNNGEHIVADIVPAKVSVKVGVTTPQKEVPIVVVPKGDLPDGKIIESYELDSNKIILYGPLDVLDKINQVEIIVPVNKIDSTNSTTITMPVILPSGVSTASITKVNIEIKLGKKEEKTFDAIPITIKNLNSKLRVTNLDELNMNRVKVYATKEILENMKVSDIEITVDLKAYSDPGTYKVTYKIKGKPSIAIFEMDVEMLKVILDNGE